MDLAHLRRRDSDHGSGGGTNVVTIGADKFIATSNVNIVFVNGEFHMLD